MESVTIIAPVYNEEESIATLFNVFGEILKSEGYTPKFLIVDDCSSDGTLNKLLQIKKTFHDPIRVVSLKQRGGQHIALLAALDHVNDTDYGVITDADMQNPPQLCIPMLRLLQRKNYNIVYGMRSGTRLGNGLLSQLFWLTITLISWGEIPRDQSPLKVFDKTFINNFKTTSHRYSNFFQAMIAQVKGTRGFYPVKTTPRTVGQSKYGLIGKLKLYFSAIYVVIVGGSSTKNYQVAAIYD